MKVRLERSACAGHALCHSVAEEIFPLDDEGYSVFQVQEVPAGSEARFRAGVDSCPEGALVVDPD